jgi:hypothetical protein
MNVEYERGTVCSKHNISDFIAHWTLSEDDFWYNPEPHNSVDQPEKSENIVNLHSTMDANVWAKEFCNTYRKLYNREIDEEWVRSWMCNAIMCGYDHQSWKQDKEYIYILKTTMGDILKVFHWEPSEKEIRAEYVKHYPNDVTGGNYNIFDYIKLYRWSRNYGLMEMCGPKSDTQYDWKSN